MMVRLPMKSEQLATDMGTRHHEDMVHERTTEPIRHRSREVHVHDQRDLFHPLMVDTEAN